MFISSPANRLANLPPLSLRGPSSHTNESKEINMFYVKNVPFSLALKIQIIWMRIRELMMRIQILFFSNVTFFVFALSLVT